MKNLKEYIIERGPAPSRMGSGSIEMFKHIIQQLTEYPDYKGKDKELWTSCGQFAYDYLKELSDGDRKLIMTTLGLEKLTDFDETTPADVMLGLHILLNKKIK